MSNWRKFCQDRHRPEGDWVYASATESVVGIAHRKASVTSFAKWAEWTSGRGARYGVKLYPEPDNEHDPNAIAVYGIADIGIWAIPLMVGREWHIGYLAAETVKELNEQFISRGIPLAAELYSIFEQNGFIDVKVLVMAPPGNSLSSRQKRQTKAERNAEAKERGWEI